MRTNPTTATVVAAAALAALGGAVLWRAQPGATLVAKLPDAQEAVRLRIANEAHDGGLVEPPTLTGIADVASFAAPAPEAPAGYSLVGDPAVMELSDGAPASDGSAISHDGVPDWLFGDPQQERHAAVVRQAGRMGRDWTYGWMRLDGTVSLPAIRDTTVTQGIEVVAVAGALARVRLPAEVAKLDAAAAVTGVAGMAVMSPERKAAADVRDEVHAAASRKKPMMVTLMDQDAAGRWRRELQNLGADVGRYDPAVHAYEANLDAVAFDAVLHADFVQAVEPVGMFGVANDTVVPAMGADRLRRWTHEPGIFDGTGGGSTPVGVMDTGLNINHQDISTHRSSICGANFVIFNVREEDADLWVDENGHGTHVTGTVAGNGYAEARYAGIAPSVAHIRLAKVLGRSGFGYSDGIFRGMDFLARPTACDGGEPVKPLIVNMSLARSSRVFRGRTVDERKLDATVWAHRQLYVVANSNSNIHGFSDYGAAKNSLAVGAIQDDGVLASFSSWGPTQDGRLAPQVVAVGVSVQSPQGGGDRGSYNRLSGTSMASPATAGVAALLMDVREGYRDWPAVARARLMASAIKPDAWLDAADAFPATNSTGPGDLQVRYGMGKASARTSTLNRRRPDGWVNGAAIGTLASGRHTHRNIHVPAGTSRLDVVLAWDEPPADTIGSTVLNDIDLWLDKDGDCEATACGEHSSVSRVDNVEWIIVRNPEPGVYRAKAVPHRVYTGKPRVGLAWTVVRGASTPTMNLTANKVTPLIGREYRVQLTLSVDGYVAAGARVTATGCRTVGGECYPGNTTHPVRGEDGIEHMGGIVGRTVTLGEVGVSERQRVVFDMELNQTPGAARLYFAADAWNAKPAYAVVEIPAADGGNGRLPAEATPPANNHFANALPLQGERGSIEADLLLATAESGEPPAVVPVGPPHRPLTSLWYRWMAPTTAAVRFSTSSRERVDVLTGASVAALTPLAAGEQGVTVFAVEGETYHIRVSKHRNSNEGNKFTLNWSQGERPVNDDFRDAVRLRGAEGEIDGSNLGATLEPGEQLGALAATVWYRWTAPDDGDWRFRADHWLSNVVVFEGDSLSTLRLVSGHPDNNARFPAGKGRTYRLAVATKNLDRSSRPFKLMWHKSSRSPANDDFANALELSGATGTERVSVGLSVEPGEPPQSGVRTRWWRWTAPASGQYTWRLDGDDTAHVVVTAFAAPGVADDMAPTPSALRPMASTGHRASGTEFVLDAVGDERYWLSIGLHGQDAAAFAIAAASADMRWGQTPGNDALSRLAELGGASGEVTFRNLYATTEPGERNGPLGDSSLWWGYTPDANGWYRFELQDAGASTVAVYRVDGPGFDGLHRVARSHGDWREPDADGAAPSALFQAEAGRRYVVRVGQGVERNEHEAVLRWDRSEAPTWLRYAGVLRADALGAEWPSGRVSWWDWSPQRMAFDERGGVLYVAVDRGVHVLERNPRDGTLTPAAFVRTTTPDALVWDHKRGELLVATRCQWRRFATGTTIGAIVDEGALDADTATPCPTKAALVDASGSHLLIGYDSGVRVFAIGESGLEEASDVVIRELRHVALNPSGDRLYAIDERYLHTYAFAETTGVLSFVGKRSAVVADGLAVGERHAVLLVQAGHAHVHSLADDGVSRNYVHMPAVRQADAPWWVSRGHCRAPVFRPRKAAFDGFCWNSAFSVVVHDDGDYPRPAAADFVAHWQADRYNNAVPEFRALAVAVSPDGRHAYVQAVRGVMIFERVGVETNER